MKVDGGCHCGFLKYEADVDPALAGICHCTDCQGLSGSAFSGFLPVPGAHVRLLGGRPRIYVKTAESGNRRAQAFCPECGTRIYASEDSPDPQRLNLRIGTIRQRAQLAPKIQLWRRSAMPWVTDLASVPGYDTQPPA